VLTLRDDLSFSLQKHGDQLCYMIEDEKNSKFYRIGIAEYKFISLLDGATTLAEAIGRTASALGRDAFTEHDAAIICKWLVDFQLAFTEVSAASDRLYERHQASTQRKRFQRLNPLVIKVPLWNPDAWVTSLAEVLKPIFRYPLIPLWCAIVFISAYHYVIHSPRLANTTQPVLGSGNLIWLFVSWISLKIVHEIAHALTCKRFGGHVREMGLVFILFAPLPYVDVTSSWRFSAK